MANIRRLIMWLLLWSSDVLKWLGFYHSSAWWWCIQWAAVVEEYRPELPSDLPWWITGKPHD